MTNLTGSVMLVALLASAPASAQTPIRLFIVAETGGFVDEKSDSAQDLEKLFRQVDDPKSKKDKVVLVNAREAADLVVEITERGNVATGNVTRPGTPYTVADAETARRVTAKLTVGEYSKTIFGDSIPPLHKWSDAARVLKAQIEKFAKDNHAKLMAARR